MSLSNLSQPVAPRERLLHVDIIRGIAVFGLIWVNLNLGFNPGPLTIADVTARWTMSTFAAGKAFTLFSLLFGVTLAMQLERADRDSRPIALRWLRRMSVLYAIGWAHAILFWPGDILRDYAIAGAVLIAFRRLSSRGLVLAAVVALALASNRDSLSVVITRLVRGNVEAVTPLDITSKLTLALGYLAALSCFFNAMRGCVAFGGSHLSVAWGSRTTSRRLHSSHLSRSTTGWGSHPCGLRVS